MIKLKDIKIICSKSELTSLPDGKILINTINAHSYNTALKDELFAEALMKGDALIPDGASIVKACRWIKAKSQPKERIAGWDLFTYEMERLAPLNPPRRGTRPTPTLPRREGPVTSPRVFLPENGRDSAASQDSSNNSDSSFDLHEPSWETIHKPKVMFMGSSEKVLGLIKEKAKTEYPHLEIITYSPPYKPEFSDEDNAAIVKAINDANPDLLWIGMTAPKQEKWAYSHWNELNIHCHCGTIGAVFDFFAGTAKRAPKWWQEHSLEWLYRLIIEPRRMWRRYIIGNALFLKNIWKEKHEDNSYLIPKGGKDKRLMKVVVTGTRGIPNILGGIETHCEELLPRIAAQGVDVTVTRRKEYVKDNATEWKGVHLVDIQTPRSKSLETIIHTFKSIVYAKRHGADIVHIHAVGPALLLPMVKLLGMKAVYTHHGPDYDREKWGQFARFMLRLGERVGTRFADGIIVISSVIKEIIEKKYNRKDCHLIFNGAPKAYFNTDKSYLNELGIEPQKYVIGMWRFVPEKNLEHLISAFDKAFPKDKDGNRKDGMKLVLAGDADFKDGYYHRLERITKEQEVILPGFVRGEKLQVLLTNARCFVLPSSHEGLSIALLEAMSYRLPVIVSDIPANKVVELDEESYFHLGDVDELTEKLRKNAETDFHNIDYDMSRYDWDDIARKTVEVYNGI